ncbi:unnamed protein product [Didymodactylos carnosus]|uniref:Uncharacterized protein n=1 Tax=Didymodactylos carnosus TaxID=1234261 RepID=A0A813ZT78_9BILA|nr:unnamed protein product [Didymodactylos carnosus]CAF3686146.1 unnamed protein product [Didymodactylos carnosus]
MLASFHYLLTCAANELGMLEDATEAILNLRNVQVRFVPSKSDQQQLQPKFFGTRFYCKVVIPLPDHMFSRLPVNGASIRIIPIFFNVGIDHHASIARMFGPFSTSAFENVLNRDSFNKLKAYVEESAKYLPDDIPDMLRSLKNAVFSNKPKNVDIFAYSENICRRAFGIKVTGCKSAKDRTSMAFTVEQAQLLIDNHEVPSKYNQHVLNEFRSNGTSIENAYQNTGIRAYAFSYLQLLTFPELYRAQPGTYGNVQT